MKRFVHWIGVFVLLVITQIEADNTRNQQPFWDIFQTNGNSVAPTDGLDFEGSGSVNVDGTHIDEEDDPIDIGDEESSGDKRVEDNDNKDIIFTDKDKDKDSKPITDDSKLMTDDSKPMTDDEDLYDGSGSGNVSLEESTEAPKITSTGRPLSACENLRSTALDKAVFIPECEEDGGFRKQQCTVDNVSKKKFCWCVDPTGVEITGTRMVYPDVPDCDFGYNLKSCVFQRVQHSQGLLGAYKPTCTDAGEYESIQCHERECWCVDALGNEIPGSVKTNRSQLNCFPTTKAPTKAPTTKKPNIVELPTPDDGYTISIDDKEKEVHEDTIVPDVVVKTEAEKDRGKEPENNYGENNKLGNMVGPTKHDDGSMLAQPGLLAAVIGGAVVGLLCMVLLVMFIVYRMRKKDEGSYPLDEQKYQNYTYTKTPDKEFYA